MTFSHTSHHTFAFMTCNLFFLHQWNMLVCLFYILTISLKISSFWNRIFICDSPFFLYTFSHAHSQDCWTQNQEVIHRKIVLIYYFFLLQIFIHCNFASINFLSQFRAFSSAYWCCLQFYFRFWKKFMLFFKFTFWSQSLSDERKFSRDFVILR